MSDDKVINSDEVLQADAADPQDKETNPTCAICIGRCYARPVCHGSFWDCTNPEEYGLQPTRRLPLNWPKKRKAGFQRALTRLTPVT